MRKLGVCQMPMLTRESGPPWRFLCFGYEAMHHSFGANNHHRRLGSPRFPSDRVRAACTARRRKDTKRKCNGEVMVAAPILGST